MGQAATVAKAARAEPSRRLGVVPSWGTAKLESMTVMVWANLVKTGVDTLALEISLRKRPGYGYLTPPCGGGGQNGTGGSEPAHGTRTDKGERERAENAVSARRAPRGAGVGTSDAHVAARAEAAAPRCYSQRGARCYEEGGALALARGRIWANDPKGKGRVDPGRYQLSVHAHFIISAGAERYWCCCFCSARARETKRAVWRHDTLRAVRVPTR